MATIAPPPPAPPSPARGPQNKSNGADQLINERIDDARRSLWWAELVRTGLKLVITSIVAVFAWLVIDQWVYSPNVAVRCIVFLGLLGLASWYVKRRVLPLFGSTVCPDYAARALERNLPELRHSLTSYVTLRQEGQKSDLQTRVVRSMGSLTAGRLKNHNEIPEEAVGNFRWWIATAVAFAILLGYSVVSPKNAWQSVQRLAVPVANISPAHRVTISDVLPGDDIEAVAGRDVDIAATIFGLRAEESVKCQWDLPSGREELELTLDPDSNRFVGQLQLPHTARGVVPYTITAGDATAGPFRLRVQDLPVVALESVKYQPPKYTGESPHTSSSGSIAGLVGTQVRILATTNRPITKARIEFNPRLRGDRLQATAGAKELIISEDGTTLSFAFTLRTAAGRSAAVEQDSYRIVVHDSTGQRNSEPIVYPIRIVSDLPPEVSITMPFQSPKEVPIDAQQVIEVHASDPDYGLKHVQLEIRTSLNLIAKPVLWSHISGQKGNQVSEYRFRPAEHNLPIGSSVKIVAVATDNRASDETVKLKPNVTRSDPIEIKITAASRLPEPDDPNAGGLSEPDNRPASDHQDSDQQGDEQSKGEQQQGSGGSGGPEGAQTQSGDQEGGDSSSKQGNSRGEQSSDQQNDQGGNGQAPGDQESEPSDNDTSDKGQNSSSSEKGNNSNEDQGDENSNGGGNSENQGDQTSDSKNTENGSNTTKGNESQNNDDQGSHAAEGRNPENQGGQTSDSDKQQSGDPSASSQQNSNNGQSSEQRPEHDGEAFERIRDFLEEKRKQQQKNNQEAG
ncbi:MAG TPA: circumsporozoite protein-membrane associated protein, partial [Rhodopirellula sp.]|nr:circumsporozoite protein-membrane associated protein [Rhodopirellula sp.]